VTRADSKLTLALPKGRVLERSLKLLRAAGLNVVLAADTRAMRHDDGDVRILTMRNSDVPVYVELGVADAGIVGKDVLLEANSNLFEPVDLGFARCRLALIRPRGAGGVIGRVASKYPRLAQQYLKETGSAAEVIPLAGNVELACLSGLADAVIDIVESGATLQANDLVEVDVILQSSARFVVNRASLKLRSSELRPLIDSLRELAA
jgi:ATP phosphoribosyltransferase